MIDQAHIDLLSLIQRDVRLKRVAGTHGGEYAGPCPFCGEGEDRLRVWPHQAQGRFWCRQCGRSGDAIDYIRERDGIDFREACAVLNIPLEGRARTVEPLHVRKSLVDKRQPLRKVRQPVALHAEGWQGGAIAFCREAQTALYDPAHERVLAYLRDRGLSDEVIQSADLGFNPYVRRAHWGDTQVYLPKGVVIPWWINDQIWRVNMRRNDNPKYIQAKGGANGLYNADSLTAESIVLMVEGEFDALAFMSALGLDYCQAHHITAVATGSCMGARLLRWRVKLSLTRRVVLAFDTDTAGEKAVEWWLGQPDLDNVVRLPPTAHDVNAMVTAGHDLRKWLAEVLSDLTA